eukprot:6217252-Pyramimonas_sp.AAC.2
MPSMRDWLGPLATHARPPWQISALPNELMHVGKERLWTPSHVPVVPWACWGPTPLPASLSAFSWLLLSPL